MAYFSSIQFEFCCVLIGPSLRRGWGLQKFCKQCSNLYIYFPGNAVPTRSPPTFADNYNVKGILLLPYAEINEPFSAFFDKQSGKSRIDYYGGKNYHYYYKRIRTVLHQSKS